MTVTATGEPCRCPEHLLDCICGAYRTVHTDDDDAWVQEAVNRRVAEGQYAHPIRQSHTLNGGF